MDSILDDTSKSTVRLEAPPNETRSAAMLMSHSSCLILQLSGWCLIRNVYLPMGDQSDAPLLRCTSVYGNLVSTNSGVQLKEMLEDLENMSI